MVDPTRPAAWTHTALAQQVVFGVGALDRLPALVRTIGARRALLVTTAGRLDSPEGDAVVAKLGRSLVSTFAEVVSHVPVPLVQQAVQQARRDGVDLIVSFGGGSCADLAKAVGFFLEQEAGMPGASHLDRPLVPHLSIPTTYSGAELTPFFGMTDPTTRQKQGAGGPTSAPVAVLYDPLLTTSTPARVSAETGMNALAHCVEAAWSPERTPEAEAIALAGATAIGRALPEVVADPSELGARTEMLEGSCLAGRCLLNAGMGVHHGLSQLVGGRAGIAHGLANAILLAHSIRFNAEAVPRAVTAVGAALGRPDDAAGAVDDLRARLGLPARLSEAGVDEADLDVVARLSQSNGNVARNPRPVSEADARSILEAAW
ncbi:MAG TPA: iron-containing alcohol dehydrogenase family protein [Acidimicrobiales bacterium]|nr:iron-containing alcohol dehydrogenase family protein [Acidimicrobiales bacterium]